MEAAALLPVLMLLFALLVQPVCLLYTRMTMQHAASEAARLLVTAQSLEDVRSFVLRRLLAVPEASLFHVGGQRDWDVTMRCEELGAQTEVEICGHVRPLPLLGVAVSLLGEHDEKGVIVRVSARERLRPKWLGGAYESWMQVWET